MRNKPANKHNAVLANGRSKGKLPDFKNWHCRVFPHHFTFPAWKALSGTARDVALLCQAKSDHAAYCRPKGENGRPIFEFTATEAESAFKIPRPTFSKALHALIALGFITVHRHGGTLDGKGIAAQYQLSDDWKTWEAPPADHSNILKARAALKARQSEG